MFEIVLTSSESDQYSSALKEISKFPLMYMTGNFCRSVYHLTRIHARVGVYKRHMLPLYTSHNLISIIALIPIGLTAMSLPLRYSITFSVCLRFNRNLQW